MRVGQRRTTRERLGRRLGWDRDRVWLEQRWLVLCAGRVVSWGAGRTTIWVAAATGATDATDATDAGATRGGCRITGRGYDLRAQLATASRCTVRASSVWLYGGAAKRGSAMETGRMSQVRTAILETGPSQWLSKLLTTNGIRIYALMPCMLQIRDGARWTQSTPTNMGRSGRGDDPSWVVRRVGWR